MIAPTHLLDGVVVSLSHGRRWFVVLGRINLITTLALGVSFVLLLAPAMTNNLYYWPRFNTSSYQVYLIDVLNVKLQTAHTGAIDLLSLDAAQHKSYATAAVEPHFASNYARRVLLATMSHTKMADADA
ncbi:Aste57867_21136 [Aphanomyces stellatus]|uniref:Aste57867_21136 protein n=1 Tax=Aphanomyces stellatus TaxID=120398 RepID=A0A485LGR2_9STRA|nr:hypothetical protein As57867_021068 [Aphanomyces stellatus]VFT97810.1 Aste57867_21136 [Aphanomyces stellatus]